VLDLVRAEQQGQLARRFSIRQVIDCGVIRGRSFMHDKNN
jgi:hypothetical protein